MKIDISSALDPVAIQILPRDPKYAAEVRLFQGIPSLEACGQGVLYATWYTGGDYEGPNNHVAVARSTDDGVTWKDPFLVIDPLGKVRAYDPALWMDPKGRLWLTWSQSYGFFDGKAGVWVSVNNDPIQTPEAWSAPRRIANGIMMNKPTALSTGEWVFPTAVWKMSPWHGDPRYIEEDIPNRPYLPEMAGELGANLSVTADEGQTFELRPGPDFPERYFDEHMVVEKRNGELMMFARTFYGIGCKISRDGGRSWQPRQDGSACNVYRIGPSTRFFIRRLVSGSVLLVYHESMRTRSHLTAYLSHDEGETWSDGLLLDERVGISYPDGAQTADGTIRIIYDRDRMSTKEILLAVFTEEEVLERRISRQGSCLRRVIIRGGRQATPPV